MKKIKCPYYQLNLDDYSCPSFCSFGKPFHGRLSDIQGLIEALALNNPEGIHDKLISAFAEFQNGNLEVTHVVAQQIEKLLTEEELIAYEDFSFENLAWEHINTWGFPYQIKASAVDVSQIIVRQGERYIRCIRPVFRSLMYRSEFSPNKAWCPLEGGYWGYPHMLEEEGEYTYSRLFFQQAVYDDAEEAIRDMNDETKIDLSAACNEIFGDG